MADYLVQSIWLQVEKNPMVDYLVKSVLLQVAGNPWQTTWCNLCGCRWPGLHGGLPDAVCMTAGGQEPHGGLPGAVCMAVSGQVLPGGCIICGCKWAGTPWRTPLCSL